MKPVDMVVAAKLVSVATNSSTFQGLADALGISVSEAHQAAKRLEQATLFKPLPRRVPYPNRAALLEFWVHGLKYVFPAVQGAPGRGMPTSVGAPPLSASFALEPGSVPVWPTAQGQVRGLSLKPIHTSALAASSDPRVYEVLALLDALREGRSREQKLAQEFLRERLYSWC